MAVWIAVALAPSIRLSVLVNAGQTMATIVEIVLVNVPLLVGALVAARLGSSRGMASALGLHRWRFLDLVIGAGAGLILRALIELLWPTTGSLGGPFGLDVVTITLLVVSLVLVSPMVEEILFRGVLVRALQSALAGAGRVVAGAAAVVASTAAFIALHTVLNGGVVPVSTLVSTALVGIACGTIVVVTSRLGGALALHLVFNASAVVLLLV